MPAASASSVVVVDANVAMDLGAQTCRDARGVRYGCRMKTLTAAEAREKLPSLLKRAKAGEEIGIISGNAIIQLKRVDVVPWEDTYLFREYGVTPEEWERFTKRQARKRKESVAAGSSKFFSGDIEKDIAE